MTYIGVQTRKALYYPLADRYPGVFENVVKEANHVVLHLWNNKKKLMICATHVRGYSSLSLEHWFDVVEKILKEINHERKS